MPAPLSPDATGVIPAKVTGKTADDINDLFKELDNEDDVNDSKDKDDEKPVRKAKEVKVDDDDDENDEEDDSDEGKSLKLIEPDEDDEKLDLAKDDEFEIDAPPRKKEILAKYPNLFKDLPYLEKMLYRDRQYSELFGSFDDAKEIAEKSEIFSQFETQLLSGKTEEILSNVKETDKKAFDRIVDNYLLSLHKVDKDAYFEVTGNIIKLAIRDMVAEANKPGNKDADQLKEAALILNQFIFNSSEYAPPKTRVNKDDKSEEQSEAERERLSYVQERFETSRDELQGRVDNILKATISEYIDPKGLMSSYVKKNAVADALRILGDSIGNDTAFKKTLDKVWRTAFDSKFSKESLNRIQSLYLGRAKGSLKNAILKAKAEALKDAAPRSGGKDADEREDDEKEEKPTPRRGIVNPGRPSQPKKNEMKKGESVTDFFMRD